jgi:hypothetical protein
MIKEKELVQSEIIIDLTGPDGNVFNLIGVGSKLCTQLGLDKNEFRKEMTSGNYEHAVETFDKYFGEFVTLLR